MADTSEYTPPKVWAWNKENGGHFASINRPIAGATHEKDLPVGRHPLQLSAASALSGNGRHASPFGVTCTIRGTAISIGCAGFLGRFGRLAVVDDHGSAGMWDRAGRFDSHPSGVRFR